MVSGRSLVVSRRSSREAAEKLLIRLQHLSLEARIEAIDDAVAAPVAAPPPERPDGEELFALGSPVVFVDAPAPAVRADMPGSPVPQPGIAVGEAAEVVCPKCGEPQPKRTLCRKCGLDMPRFLAARDAAEQEAREELAAEVAAKLGAPRAARAPAESVAPEAALFGLGFAGRFGRLHYLAGSLFSAIIWLAFVLLAVKAGRPGIAWIGILLSAIYGFRCVALRLHDCGRTGWLSLVMLVPVLGVLMFLALLFIPGDDEANDHGPQPLAAGGRAAFASLLVLIAMANLSYRTMTTSPEKLALFTEAVSLGQADVEAEDAYGAEGRAPPDVAVNYADDNHIEIYVIATCPSCDQMRSWLQANGLRHSVLAVDNDQQAAERLHTLVAGNETMLPVLVINGDVLPGDPGTEQVHRRLRRK